MKEQDKGNVRTRSQIQMEQRLAKYKAEEIDKERLMAMFRASMKVSMGKTQAELERERKTSRRQKQQHLESLISRFTPLVQAAQTNQSAIQNAPCTAQNTTIQTVKFTDGMDIDAYLTTFELNNEEITQLVVSKPCRSFVMRVTHESQTSGHTGVASTLDRIIHRFFWPGVRQDVKRFACTCEPCQLVAPLKPKERVPMLRLPVIEEPFRRIAADTVGPLVPSQNGHPFLLVISDCCTHYPETIPLRPMNSKKIAEKFELYFCRVSVSEEILIDQGSNCVAKSLLETGYPQTDDLVENLNGALVRLLKKFVVDNQKDWDRFDSCVLFAYRETPKASTKFSPFDILYGRRPRGPLDVIKKQ
ncbi:hypothetical protein QYM36_008267 [Artemia franciscana]|uniref:RNA-directed DNA polymerase n=1 Tax=Artemia franciscana TaxID=6661 RepID=A0AA88IFH0_ARTSF|nr:hypothetical protein QYM36_008267 [Artemia franciscana]